MERVRGRDIFAEGLQGSTETADHFSENVTFCGMLREGGVKGEAAMSLLLSARGLAGTQ